MNATDAWPATCATCGRPVRKAESHSGAPASGIAVRHLDCTPTKHTLERAGLPLRAPKPRNQCGTPERRSGVSDAY